MEGKAFDLEAEQAAQEQAAETAELTKLTNDSDVEWLMSTQQGRRVMWRLLSLAGVYRTSFAGEETHATAFAEGARNIGLQLIHEVQRLTPDAYSQMVKEQRNG